jgi:hypothetical protein
LHLWQAVQIVIDLAVSLCVRLHLGAPGSYSDAFGRLAKAGHLDAELASRLGRAAGFGNLVGHAYEPLDMQKVYAAARSGPADLRAFSRAPAISPAAPFRKVDAASQRRLAVSPATFKPALRASDAQLASRQCPPSR